MQAHHNINGQVEESVDNKFLYD